MAAEDFIVAAEVDGKRRDGRIFRAAAYGQEMLEEQFEDQLQWRDTVRWDRRSQSVAARRQRSMGAIILQSQTLATAGRVTRCALR
jgi:ATP-dependent helicase HrpB